MKITNNAIRQFLVTSIMMPSLLEVVVVVNGKDTTTVPEAIVRPAATPSPTPSPTSDTNTLSEYTCEEVMDILGNGISDAYDDLSSASSSSISSISDFVDTLLTKITNDGVRADVVFMLEAK